MKLHYLYVANGTYLDVSFLVYYLTHQNSQSNTHYKYSLRVLKYLSYTSSIKLMYDSSYNEEMDAYVNTD